jgi:hypothetical protein
MATYTLIEAKTLSSNAVSVTFSAIPATFTDLVIKMSTRVTNTGNSVEGYLTFNGSSSNFTWTSIYGNGVSTKGSSQYFTNPPYVDVGSSAPVGTFSNTEIYIPSYTASRYKQIDISTVPEDTATSALYMYYVASLWSNNAAITSATLTSQGNYISGSSFYLYGISNA